MVFGSIMNWVVFRTLDLTVSTIWWATKSTAYGVYSVGHYIIVPKNTYHPTDESFEMIPLMISNNDNSSNELLIIKEQLKEQTELLRNEIELLKAINQEKYQQMYETIKI